MVLRIPTFRRRDGLTLIEILIGLTMTLIVLGAMMVAFQYASEQIARGRAVIEMSNQLRGTQELLRKDLNGLTVDPRPHTQTSSSNGFFEYIEGPGRDAINATSATDNYLGDIDDILTFTARSASRPFRGRDNVNGGIKDSTIAEIIWWTDWDDRNGDGNVDYDETVSVYRRAMLVRPDIDLSAVPAATLADVQDFFARNDISARWIDFDGDGTRDTLVANTLSDLAKRENRFARNSLPAAFPHAISRLNLSNSATDSFRMGSYDSTGTLVFTGDDVILTDVAGFDLKIYSPDASIKEVNNLIVETGDRGYSGVTFPAASLGSYVDLNHASVGGTGMFSALPKAKSQLNAGDLVYDTWSPHYEHDGINQDAIFETGTPKTDEGTNGLNDQGSNDGSSPAVDDNDERETLPPYAEPIRGMKIVIRLIEKKTKQVRQASIIHSFVPE